MYSLPDRLISRYLATTEVATGVHALQGFIISLMENDKTSCISIATGFASSLAVTAKGPLVAQRTLELNHSCIGNLLF